MGTRTRRKNRRLLLWVRAAAVAIATWGGLAAMKFTPMWGIAAFSAVAALLTLVAVDLGILVAVMALSIPLLASDPLLGLLVLVLGVVTIRYLGADGGRVFFLVAGSIIGSFAGPVWAVVALAGYLLGPGEGALAAAMGCVGLELLGLTMGREALGATITGGNAKTALLHFPGVEGSLFSIEWIKAAFSGPHGIGPETVKTFTAHLGALQHSGALIAQPIIWGIGAMIAGTMARNARKSHKPWLGYTALAVGIFIPMMGAAVLKTNTGAAIQTSTLGIALISSLVVSAAFAWVWDRLFKLEVVEGPSREGSMAAEDADVDELLRLVATAEEKLATEHTTVKTVMITDMKSFSKMTEEDGSILTAKAIQKHRDLLLPIIQKHGGHGKSTGGDGLVAAFDSEEAAARAAVEMQQVLAANNAAHPDAREMTVRIGVASGDIVLDKGGRPFIGNALNLAARVMNLADGGQSFITAAVYAKAGSGLKGHSHGDFELKNIAKPVEIIELLWAEGQEPSDPRQRTPAA